jgi:hypothetical protein
MCERPIEVQGVGFCREDPCRFALSHCSRSGGRVVDAVRRCTPELVKRTTGSTKGAVHLASSQRALSGQELDGFGLKSGHQPISGWIDVDVYQTAGGPIPASDRAGSDCPKRTVTSCIAATPAGLADCAVALRAALARAHKLCRLTKGRKCRHFFKWHGLDG